MNKIRPIKLILSLTLIIFIMLINTVGVSAEQFELTAKFPYSVNIGNSFDIIFSSEANTNIKAIKIKASYNSDYISFKNIDNLQSGEIKFNNENSKIDFIILFDSTLKKGDVFKLQFTAKSGNNSSNQNISFEVSEAVDNNLNDVLVKISSNVGIEIIKKGDQNSEKETHSTESDSAALSESKSKSKSVTSAKSYKSGGEVSVSSSANANNSRTGSYVYSSDYSDDKKNSTSDTGIIDNYYDNDITADSQNNTTSISQLGSGKDIGNLNLKDSRAKYVFVGIGITLSVMGILFVVFRLGQLSRRKPESDKMFPEDGSKSED